MILCHPFRVLQQIIVLPLFLSFFFKNRPNPHIFLFSFADLSFWSEAALKVLVHVFVGTATAAAALHLAVHLVH